MAKSLATEVEILKKDNEYINAEIRDVKRQNNWLLGLFATLFVLLVSSFVALVG